MLVQSGSLAALNNNWYSTVYSYTYVVANVYCNELTISLWLGSFTIANVPEIQDKVNKSGTGLWFAYVDAC